MSGGGPVFESDRLKAFDWHDVSPPAATESLLTEASDSASSLAASSLAAPWLARVVEAMLTPAVTAHLPPAWQGPFDSDRAARWIRERDAEGRVLLVVEQESGSPVGLVMLHHADSSDPAAEVRLGYLLAESSWGRGYATELIRGLTEWAGRVGVRSVVGGVSRENHASIRVLEKAGFERLREEGPGDEVFYRWVPPAF